jgi:opacity protein-like surface antigen
MALCHTQHKRLTKMKKLLMTAITTAALLPLCATAQADAHSSEKTASDMYIGATFGKGKHNIKSLTAAEAAAFDEDVTTMSLFVGRDLNETFAIEGFYTNLGKSKFTTGTTIKATTMGIAVKAGTDLTEDLRGFVKVGYHSWESRSATNDDGTDVLYGAGLEYKLSDTTAILAGYDRYTANDDNVTDMNIGIKYRF